MSVKRTLMAAHRTVEIHQGHSDVAVIQAMSWAVMVGLVKVSAHHFNGNTVIIFMHKWSYYQISMSVQLEHIFVLKSVPILWDLMCAAVESVIDWTMIESIAVVGPISINQLKALPNTPPTYTDINECQEGLHSCTQTCVNTIGSYTCQCREGYMLSRDLRTCEG